MPSIGERAKAYHILRFFWEESGASRAGFAVDVLLDELHDGELASSSSKGPE